MDTGVYSRVLTFDRQAGCAAWPNSSWAPMVTKWSTFDELPSRRRYFQHDVSCAQSFSHLALAPAPLVVRCVELDSNQQPSG